MTIATLRQIGGSTCITIPKVYLDRLELEAGSTVNILLHGNCLHIEPQKPVYRLDELLASAPEVPSFTGEDHQWLNARPVGKEVW